MILFAIEKKIDGFFFMYPFVCGPQLQMDKTTCQQNKGK
jgi:hypothetical protein